ncbi:nitroreductase family protein [Moraxella bovis]|uniref:Nitroreductase family protein n=1 Tax=Moraxella bovis TaxID=476 RepID=A0AAQ2Q1P3_MORBO|nr:nitroreductase family protein [Moraxella bovis]AWY20648.1 nitroreductase family protein [Moraxella bovis]UYZ76673.1 nitroreductase family protein [Moraxella bovis]UYZ77374.1 nitroreductase family protein [Moraxella bovis]UYZ82147.1 nitroreductase family protein [Moraxella bovis]UYZ85859.1 nitroreductase family protein [Moraxella bovis]
MSVQTLQATAELRRSIYALDKNSPLTSIQIDQIVEHALLHTPSSFNSQSTRLVVLHGSEHEKLWDATTEILRAIVPAENFAPTQDKLNAFKAGAGTVLFFEDTDVVKGLQEQFPAYADNFPIWAGHANAMVQYAIWTTLASANVGANLQHYNPLINDFVASEWDVPSNWQLVAQMVFGGITAPAGEKTFAPVAERLKVFG